MAAPLGRMRQLTCRRAIPSSCRSARLECERGGASGGGRRARAARAQDDDAVGSTSAKASKTGPRLTRGERKKKWKRERADPVLRRRKETTVDQSAVETQPEDSQFDSVNPISLGRRARQEVDSAWQSISRLAQFTSTSLSDTQKGGVADMLDLIDLETLGSEVPQAVDTRVLIIGATESIGRVVLNKLLLRGYTVRVLVESISDDVLELFPPSVELIQGDISDLNAIHEATRDCDKVVCCTRARTNLMLDMNRVESQGVQNVVTTMLHHKNERAPTPGGQTQKTKLVLYKFQKFKKDHKAKTKKWGKWIVGEQPKDSLGGSGKVLSRSAEPKVNVKMPDEDNNCFVFEGTNADYAETTTAVTLPEGVRLDQFEGLVLNLHGNGKKVALVLYTEEEGEEGATEQFGYVSEFNTIEKSYCTRRIPFNAFTRLSANQPPLNLKNVTKLGFRYRSVWNKEAADPRTFRLKVDWVKALPTGPEPEVILVTPPFEGEDASERERALKPKRAGEAHLRNSGLLYTIIRPATLVDNVVGGTQALFFDQNAEGGPVGGTVSSADIADVCVNSLHNGASVNKTFDVSFEASASSDEFELVAHIPDKNSDYVASALGELEKNT